MNFYTVAARINKQIEKVVSQARDAGHDNLDEWRDVIRKRELTTARRNMELGIDLMLMYKEIATDKGLLATPNKRTWFITIRPDTTLITFDTFYNLIHKFVHRQCFVTYTLSFEQKGISEDTLGQGFHVHIIAHMKQRSKTEVLRDTQSTFKNCTAANCIDVQVCKNPEETKQHYLIDYASNDNHKIITKEWDELWRQQEGLQPIYENNLDARIIPVALSSPTRLLDFS